MRWYTAIVLILAATGGCTPDNDNANNRQPAPDSPVANAPQATSSDATASKDAASSEAGSNSGKPDALINEVEISQTDFAKLESMVQSFNGRVVVLDVWSTSCLPCMKEFPHLVELARRWPEDVVCISLNLDYTGLPSQPVSACIPKAKEFLVSQAADATNLLNLISSESDEVMYTKFKIEALPAIMIYDRQGKLAKQVTVETSGDNGLTYAEDVTPTVEQLIESR